MDTNSSSKWPCAVCTFENWPAAFKCTLCGNLRNSPLIEAEMQRLKLSPNISEHTTGNHPSTASGCKQLIKCCYCTYLNQSKSVKCEQCFQVLDDSPAIESQLSKQTSPVCSPRNVTSLSQQVKWTCGQCTYENWPKSKQCVMCHANPACINMCDNESHENTSLCLSSNPSGSTNRKSKTNLFTTSLTSRDRLWLLACLAIVNGELAPIERYVLANGKVDRRLTKPECRYLNTLLSSNTSTIELELQSNLDLTKSQIDCSGHIQTIDDRSPHTPTSTSDTAVTDSREDCVLSRPTTACTPNKSKFRSGLTLVDIAIRFGRADLIHLFISLIGLQATSTAISGQGTGNKSSNLSGRYNCTNLHLNDIQGPNKICKIITNCTSVATHVHPELQQLLNRNPNLFQTPDTRTKWMPCEASPNIAIELRHFLTKLLHYPNKWDFGCAYFSEWSTFALPHSITKLSGPIKQLLLSELCDMQAQSELEDDAKAINWWFVPGQKQASRLFALWNRTAGDCLLDSALQACWCVFDRDNFLRHALAESLKSCEAHFYPRWRNYEALQAASHYILDEDQCQRDWENVLAAACQPHEALEQIHIFALCHILRRPIIVYGVKYIKNYRDEPIGIANFQGIYLPLLWDQSFCSKNPIVLGYTRGHFTALVPIEPNSMNPSTNIDSTTDNQNILSSTTHNQSPAFLDESTGVVGFQSSNAGAPNNPVSDSQLSTPGETSTIQLSASTTLGNAAQNIYVYLPLVDKQGTSLPIHFTTEKEANISHTLLRDWLDVVYTRRGLPLSRLRLHPKHALVENMLEEWLDSYRSLSKLPNHASVLSNKSIGREPSSASSSTASSLSDADQANIAKSISSSSRDTSPSN